MDDSPETVSDSAAARFLAVAAAELERLRTESEYAAGEIDAAATAEGVDDGSAIADLAVALRERAAEIAAECERLDRLVSAAAAAQAAAVAAVGPRDPVSADDLEQNGKPEAEEAQAPAVAAAQEAPIATPDASSDEPERPPESDGEQPDTALPDEEPADEESFRAPAAHPDLPPEEVSEGVKLLVTQMAVGGSPRREIERRLEDEFGIADPARVLAELFGPQG